MGEIWELLQPERQHFREAILHMMTEDMGRTRERYAVQALASPQDKRTEWWRTSTVGRGGRISATWELLRSTFLPSWESSVPSIPLKPLFSHCPASRHPVQGNVPTHCTHDTVHCILYTVKCSLYTVHCLPCTVKCLMCTVHYKVFCIHCTLCLNGPNISAGAPTQSPWLLQNWGR